MKGNCMAFIKENMLLIFCVLALIWLGEVIFAQFKYKKKAVRLEGKVVGHQNQNGNFFPIYEFEYNGENLRVDSYNGTKEPMQEGETETIYYLPGNQKGVFAERNIGIKPWQIVCGGSFLLYIILRVITLVTK